MVQNKLSQAVTPSSTQGLVEQQQQQQHYRDVGKKSN
jgi:hypothetical protein